MCADEVWKPEETPSPSYFLSYNQIDPFNFWEPIEMEIEGIGTIKVLKVIDVGNAVMVDVADTNRLIDE